MTRLWKWMGPVWWVSPRALLPLSSGTHQEWSGKTSTHTPMFMYECCSWRQNASSPAMMWSETSEQTIPVSFWLNAHTRSVFLKLTILSMWQKSCVFDSWEGFGRGLLRAVKSRQHTHLHIRTAWQESFDLESQRCPWQVSQPAISVFLVQFSGCSLILCCASICCCSSGSVHPQTCYMLHAHAWDSLIFWHDWSVHRKMA